MYADDTKLLQVVPTTADVANLQADLDRWVSWTSANKMEFNIPKCKIMHVNACQTPPTKPRAIG